VSNFPYFHGSLKSLSLILIFIKSDKKDFLMWGVMMAPRVSQGRCDHAWGRMSAGQRTSMTSRYNINESDDEIKEMDLEKFKNIVRTNI